MSQKSIKKPLQDRPTRKNAIIVILGPTATGKSDLAVRVASTRRRRLSKGRLCRADGRSLGEGGHEIVGEVISADSRQVYTGLDIATGKITKKEMRAVPHHLLDVVNPRTSRVGDFSVDEWRKLALKSIEEIISRGHVPIICGGTGFYIQSIVDNIVLPEVPPNAALRKKLERKTLTELVNMLKKLDPARLKNIDQKNPVRLIRAIEIATALGKVPKFTQVKSKYEFVQIGLTTDMETLQKRIKARVASRMKKGMIAEAENLHKDGLSYARMRDLGMEYKSLAEFLGGKFDKKALVEQIYASNVDYAKRQMTWFKRDKRITWFDVSEKGWEKKVLEYLRLDLK